MILLVPDEKSTVNPQGPTPTRRKVHCQSLRDRRRPNEKSTVNPQLNVSRNTSLQRDESRERERQREKKRPRNNRPWRLLLVPVLAKCQIRGSREREIIESAASRTRKVVVRGKKWRVQGRDRDGGTLPRTARHALAATRERERSRDRYVWGLEGRKHTAAPYETGANDCFSSRRLWERLGAPATRRIPLTINQVRNVYLPAKPVAPLASRVNEPPALLFFSWNYHGGCSAKKVVGRWPLDYENCWSVVIRGIRLILIDGNGHVHAHNAKIVRGCRWTYICTDQDTRRASVCLRLPAPTVNDKTRHIPIEAVAPLTRQRRTSRCLDSIIPKNAQRWC